MADQARLISDFLDHMPGGGSQWRQLPPRLLPEGQHQLKVFSQAAQQWLSTEQKVVEFLESSLQNTELSNHLEMFNLVQFWAPIQTSPQTLWMSVSGQPFGVGLLCDGVQKYRYECISYIQKPCLDIDGDPVSSAFASGSPRYQHRHYHHMHRFDIQSRWALPLVDLPTKKCHGVLEFVTVCDYRPEHHGMATESFMNFGPIRYDLLLNNVTGTSFQIDNSSFATNSANEFPDSIAQYLLNPTDEQFEALTQEIMGGTSCQINEGATSGVNREHPTISNSTKMVIPENEVQQPTADTPESSRKRSKSTQNKGTAKRGRPPCRSTGTRKKTEQQNLAEEKIVVKAKYGTNIVLLKIDGTTGFKSLCEKMQCRFQLNADNVGFKIEYNEGGSGDSISITCDEDLQLWVGALMSSSNKETAGILNVSKQD